MFSQRKILIFIFRERVILLYADRKPVPKQGAQKLKFQLHSLPIKALGAGHQQFEDGAVYWDDLVVPASSDTLDLGL